MVYGACRTYFFLILLATVTSLFLPNAYADIEVVEVIGGDIYLLSDGREVRLAGVDTKVIRRPGWRGSGFSDEALRYIANLFKSRDASVVESGLEPDKENRLVVYLYLKGNEKVVDSEIGIGTSIKSLTLLNLEVIRAGYGKVKWGYKGKYRDSFKAAGKRAKKMKIGLWRR
jgi:endonuclease YncB( thermonuclease family)